MKNFKLTYSTILIYLDAVNESYASEGLKDVKFLTRLEEDLDHDHKMMLEDFGKDDEDVKRYELAIEEISTLINIL